MTDVTTASTRATQPATIDEVSQQPQLDERVPHRHAEINVGRSERKISLLAGSGLVLYALSRRSLGGLALAALGSAVAYRGLTGHCHGYKLLGLNTADRDEPIEPEEYFQHGIHVEWSVTIQRPAEELYRFWRDFGNLPRFMQHLKSVEVLDEKRSRWVAKAPAGWSVQWDAEIINEETNALISWRSIGGADVDNAGSVRFIPAPGDRGTEVRVVIDYIPPAGKLGSIVARMFGEDPQTQIREDLGRFKQLVETGEIATTEGQPHGQCQRGTWV